MSRQENVPIAAGNSMREEQLQTHSDERKHSNSNSTRRRVATTSELRNMEYTNRQYMSKIFQQYTSRLLNGFNLILQKRRLHMRQERSLSKFLEPSHKPKVVYTDNAMEFGKACASTPHRSETCGIAERAVRRLKEGTSAVFATIRIG